jgi:hypothetical protein
VLARLGLRCANSRGDQQCSFQNSQQQAHEGQFNLAVGFSFAILLCCLHDSFHDLLRSALAIVSRKTLIDTLLGR